MTTGPAVSPRHQGAPASIPRRGPNQDHQHQRQSAEALEEVTFGETGTSHTFHGAHGLLSLAAMKTPNDGDGKSQWTQEGNRPVSSQGQSPPLMESQNHLKEWKMDKFRALVGF